MTLGKIEIYGIIAIIGALICFVGMIGMIVNRPNLNNQKRTETKINLVNDGETGMQIKQVKANGYLPAHGIKTGSNNTHIKLINKTSSNGENN